MLFPNEHGQSSITVYLSPGKFKNVFRYLNIFKLAYSSLAETRSRDIAVLENMASEFNLTYHAWGTRISKEYGPSSGSLNLSDAFKPGREPAPITPTGDSAYPYRLLAGTIKATYNSHRGLTGQDNIIVSPGMSPGNTGNSLAHVTMIGPKFFLC